MPLQIDPENEAGDTASRAILTRSLSPESESEPAGRFFAGHTFPL